MSMEDTIFDKMIRKEIPADIIYEDEHILAFRDINPQAPIHALVIPKKKMLNLSEMKDREPVEIGHFMCGVSKVAAMLELDNGFRVVFNNGTDGQQTVNYIHAHILGGRTMKWPPG